MKQKNWWVQTGILTSGGDPTDDISNAAANFPDEFVPMLFMTGDGHRMPAFRWTERGLWPDFFRELVEDDKVCCYVETFPDQVTIERVPNDFAKVFQNGKVFGWEPDVFKTILGVLELGLGLRVRLKTQQALPMKDIVKVTQGMALVHNAGYLRSEMVLANQYLKIAKSADKDPVPVKWMAGYCDFLTHYDETAMELRTGIHPVIAAFIQKRIDKYPDHVHLISVGDAHVYTNPLYLYIKPPIGTFGIADQIAR